MLWECWESHSKKVGIAGGGGGLHPHAPDFHREIHITFLLFTCLVAFMDVKILSGFLSFLQGGWTNGMDNILASLSYRDVVIIKNIKLHFFVFRILTSFKV